MVRYRRAIPVLLYQSASTVCAGINSSQRQGQRSLHIILSSFRIKLRGWERMCKKTLFAMQTFQSIFCNIWKRMEETKCHCSESGYLYTRPEKKKSRRCQSTKWTAKKIKQSVKRRTGESQSRLVILCNSENTKERIETWNKSEPKFELKWVDPLVLQLDWNATE